MGRSALPCVVRVDELGGAEHCNELTVISMEVPDRDDTLHALKRVFGKRRRSREKN
jgi:hypothetical protein